MEKVVLITGGSSGIGLAAAEAFQQAGCRVYTLSRNMAKTPAIEHLCADVTDETAVCTALKTVYSREGRVDILVNCAGFGISGAAEFTSAEDAERQLRVNFFGTVNACKAALPLMRAQGGGRIVNVSSVAAPVAIPFQAFYSASKAAINSYTCALANEVRPFGISVTAVQPGDICTGFTAARKKSVEGDEVYGGRIARSVARMEHDEKNGMPPARVGRYLCKVALKRRVKPLYTVGFSYRCVCLLCKLLPCGMLNRIIAQLYAK